MPFQFLDDNSATVSQPPVVPPNNIGSTAGEPHSPETSTKPSFKFLDDSAEPPTTADSLLQAPPAAKSSFALLDNSTTPPTSDDLEGLMAQGYKPNDQDLRTIYAHEWDKPFSKIGKTAVEGVTGIVKPFLKAPGEIAQDPSATRTVASLAEGPVAAASGIVGLLTKPVRAAWDKIQTNPALAANLVIPGASALLPDLSTPASKEAAYERWRLNYLSSHDVGVTPLPSSIMDSWTKTVTPGGGNLPQKAIPQPYPETSQALGTLASLPLFEAGAEASGLSRLIAAPKSPFSGAGLRATGKVLESTGKIAETVGGLPEAVTEGLSKKVLGKELGEKFGNAVDVGELPVAAGAALLGHHTIAAALAGAKALEKAGPIIGEAGAYATRLAEADPASPFGRLLNVAKDASAPEWMRMLSNSWLAKVPAAAADIAATGGKAAAVGGLFGGGLSALSGDNPEDIGRNIGAGAAFGLATAGLSASALRKSRILQATAGAVDDFVQQHVADGISIESLKKVGNDAMTWGAVAQHIFGDGTKIRFAPEGPDSPLPKSAYNQAGQYVPETKTAWINLSSNRSPAETVLHEIIHPIFDSEVANQPEIKQAIADQLTQAGKTPLQAKVQYVMRELAPSLKGLDPEAQKQAIAEKIAARDSASQQTSGDPDHWIYSEILAESAVQSLYGQHPILDVTNPGLKSWALDKVKGALEGLGVKFQEKPSNSGAQTILPDFKGVIDSQPLRKVVYSLIKAQKEFLPGISEAPEHGTKITKEMWGQHPAATLEPQADGSKANDFVIQNPDGRIIPRSPRQVKKIVKSRREEINKLYPPDAPPVETTDTTTDIKPRKTPAGLIQRTGTTLGPDFDKLTTVGAQTKAIAHEIEKMIAEGSGGSGWYQQIGTENEGGEWKESVRKDTGAIEAQYKDFIPFQFRADKQGNLLVDNTSLTAFQRKAAQWAQRHGQISLDAWGGDIGHFANDVKLYYKNQAEGLPGEANNLGVEKKNLINAFLIGGNRAFGEKNPLRAQLKGKDRAGIIRSYRLDRLETLDPLQTDFAKPNYNKQVQNLSPDLEDVNKLTPEEFFFTADSWKKAALAGTGPTVQETAEQAAMKNPDRAAWEAGLKAAQDQAKQVKAEVTKKPASMMDRQRELMGAAQKVQFYSEGLKHLDKLNSPVQFSPDVPLTDAGKKLVEQGYRFETRENEDAGEDERSLKVSLYKGDEYVGGITARLPVSRESLHGDNALIDGVKIEKPYQGQKLSEPLYRELATRLQQQGIKSTTGFVVHPAPLKIRNKLFGEPKEQDVVEGSSATGRFPTTYVTHGIDPNTKFSPDTKPIDIDKISKKKGYEESGVVVLHRGTNPLEDGEAFSHGKFYLSPSGRWLSVEEHDDAARFILGNKAPKKSSYEPNNAQAQLELHHGFVRVIDNDELYFTSQPSASQLKELKNVAIENKRRLIDDRNGGRVIYAPEDQLSPDTEPKFFSQLKNVVDEKFSGESMPKAQLAAMLRNPTSGVKAEELKWSGLDEALKGSGKISKSEVQNLLAANQIQIKEITKGGDTAATELPEGWTAKKDKNEFGPLWRVYNERGSQVMASAQHFDNAEDAIRAAFTPEETQTTFERYQLPGGRNYKEILFTLPNNKSRMGLVDAKDAVIVAYKALSKEKRDIIDRKFISRDFLYELDRNNVNLGDFSGAASGESLVQLRAAYAKLKAARESAPDEFKSTHYDEPNILAHARVNDRVDSEGKPGLFAEEIQSDWHQKGRKKGYQNATAKDLATAEFRKHREALLAEGYTEDNGYWSNPNGEVVAMTKIGQPVQTEDPKLQPLIDAYSEYQKNRNVGTGVPDAPFKKTWHEFVFRRLLQAAAQQGKEWLGWTTGEQQAARYDLSKQVDAINYREDGEGTYELSAVKDGNSVLTEHGQTPEKLENLVGKDITKKILAGEGQETPMGVMRLTGLDLKVGGEGMEGFYDKILVDYANKFGKKFGAKVVDRQISNTVERGSLSSRGRAYTLSEFDEDRWHWVDDNREPVGPEFTNKADAEAWRDGKTTTEIHSLPITPAMKKSLTETGVQLFSPSLAPEEAFKQAKEFFGVTKNLREGGFALPDGTLLDLSGRHESKSAPPDQRSVEHREVYKLPALKEVAQTALDKRKGLTDLEAANDPVLFQAADEPLDAFMKLGAMRFDAAGGTAHFMAKPTISQLNVLKRIGDSYGGQVVVDVEDGKRHASLTGPARKVIGRIRRFYRGEDFADSSEIFSPTLSPDEAKKAEKIDKKSVDTGAKNLLQSGNKQMINVAPQTSNKTETRQPNEDVRANAASYMKLAGLPYQAHQDYRPIDEVYSRAAADFYQAATHNPKDPGVKAAYSAFGKETVKQWKHLEDQGVKFEPWTKPGQPYKNSAAMAQDVRDNKHLWFFPTDAGFGTGEAASDHPMLEGSGVFLKGRELPLNDIFRAVHDYFGHAKEGYEFGPRGEYNAFLAHSRMYSRGALPAMAMETHGQNSWANFGPHMRDAEGNLIGKGDPGYLPLPDRPYAEQKANLFPVALDKLSPDIDEAAKFVADSTLKTGGATYNVASGKPVGQSKIFGVSLYPERSEILDQKDVTPERVRTFLLVNADLLKDKSNNVGSWFDKDTGKVYLDVTVGVSNRKLAVYLAQQTNQKAIWDSEAGKEINTGGTGEPVKNLPPAESRLPQLVDKYEYENQRPRHAYDSRFKKQGMF